MLDTPVKHANMTRLNLDNGFKLKAFIQDGSIWNTPAENQDIPLHKIFDNDFIGGGIFSTIMLPLYFGETIYGFILLDLNEKIFPSCEFVSFQLGQSARLINLLKQLS